MPTVKTELLELAAQAVSRFVVPPIRQLYMPEPRPSPERDSEFGIVVLEDGSAGLYYAWMGTAQTGMNARYAGQEFAGMAPLALAQYYQREHEADRSLGLAAINAISQSVFRQVGLQLDTAGDSMGELDIKPGDHVGMVGYFPSLVRRLRTQDVQVTVLERKSHLVQEDEQVRVTLDRHGLRECNKILSTASTLLNDSIDEVLDSAGRAEIIVVVGPTAGFFPDPLFARGVSAVGGADIIDTGLAITRLSRQQGPGDAARKYLIRARDYPGFAGLCSREQGPPGSPHP